MNGETRHDRVELAQHRQWMVEAVIEDRDGAVIREPLSQPLEHQGGEIECDHLSCGMNGLDQRHEPAVAASKIEKPIDPPRQPLEQRSFTLGSMWNPVGTRQVLEGVISRRPEVGRDNGHPNAERRTWNAEPRTQKRT